MGNWNADTSGNGDRNRRSDDKRYLDTLRKYFRYVTPPLVVLIVAGGFIFEAVTGRAISAQLVALCVAVLAWLARLHHIHSNNK